MIFQPTSKASFSAGQVYIADTHKELESEDNTHLKSYQFSVHIFFPIENPLNSERNYKQSNKLVEKSTVKFKSPLENGH